MDRLFSGLTDLVVYFHFCSNGCAKFSCLGAFHNQYSKQAFYLHRTQYTGQKFHLSDTKHKPLSDCCIFTQKNQSTLSKKFLLTSQCIISPNRLPKIYQSVKLKENTLTKSISLSLSMCVANFSLVYVLRSLSKL